MTQWTMRQSLLCLIGSTLLTLTLSLGIYWLYHKHKTDRLYSSAYRISTIIQTGPEKEALKTSYLAELLGLSADHPTQLYAFDIKKAQARLRSSPLIASAKIKRLPPDTLYIDYEVRKPIAWLADYKNTAVDKDGYLFPMTPFFSPKHLPEIYLGAPPFSSWKINSPQLTLALEILSFLETTPWDSSLRIKRIDVSNALATSLGMREVVLLTEDQLLLPKSSEHLFIFPKILRLTPKEYPTQLAHFFSLRKSMTHDYQRQISTLRPTDLPPNIRYNPRIIDLRIPQLAFVEK